jgi:hypothetical protein
MAFPEIDMMHQVQLSYGNLYAILLEPLYQPGGLGTTIHVAAENIEHAAQKARQFDPNMAVVAVTRTVKDVRY